MKDISSAIKAICDEKGLTYEAVLATIESALAAAYRKDYGKKDQNIVVEFSPEAGKSKVFDVKEVVEDQPEEEVSEEEGEEEAGKEGEKSKEKPEAKKPEAKEVKESEETEDVFKFSRKNHIQLSDAKLLKKTAKIGDIIKTKLEVPAEYGRMAAQTAKQVIIQRLREAEREMIFSDFKGKEREVVSGVVQRREGRIVLVDLGRAVGILPPEEQIQGERYRTGERVKIYIKEVNLKPKGPEIVLSRTSDEILKKVFYLEIPEISNGLIDIKSVAREAGYRSKVAVWTDSDNVDPIGSCVGQRGARIQTVINELGGEKVDIIQYDEEPVKYIANALSPAKISEIVLNHEENKAKVVVMPDQLSLAIGKGGQNARLAAKLTGWRIDIVGKNDDGQESAVSEAGGEEEKDAKKDKKDKKKKERGEIKPNKEADDNQEDTDKKIPEETEAIKEESEPISQETDEAESVGKEESEAAK